MLSCVLGALDTLAHIILKTTLVGRSSFLIFWKPSSVTHPRSHCLWKLEFCLLSVFPALSDVAVISHTWLVST